MFNLIIRIVAGIVFVIFYKISVKQNCNSLNTCFAFFSVSAFIALAFTAIAGNLVITNLIIIISFVCGIFTSVAVYFFMSLLKISKLGPASIIVNLSFFIPVLVSIFVFKEKITILIIIALILMIMTFYLFSERKSEFTDTKNRYKWFLVAVITTISSGIADAGPEFIEEFNLSDLASTYLSFTFLFALVPVLFISIKRKQFPNRKEWLIGSGLGVSYFFSMFFMVLSLNSIPAVIAYPAVIIIVNIVIVILAFFIWKERLNLKQSFGFALGIASAILLSLNF